MKITKFLLPLAAVLLFSSASASAAIVNCNTILNLGQLLAGGSSDDNGCVAGDKTFTNWTYTGATAATDVDADILAITQNLHTVSFLGPWTSPFQINYRVAITAGFPFDVISHVAMDINAPNAGGQQNSSTAMKQLTPDQGAPVVLMANNQSPSAGSFINARSIAVQINGTPGGLNSPLVGVSDTYTQTVIPEPGTYALLGMGLIGLVAAHRRRR